MAYFFRGRTVSFREGTSNTCLYFTQKIWIYLGPRFGVDTFFFLGGGWVGGERMKDLQMQGIS